VVSQTFDHTSVVKFIEQRWGVTCPNISPWRREITGDLLTAFDFDSFDASWPTLPDTSSYVPTAASECKNLPAPKIPKQQNYPLQEPGTKLSRALPYVFLVQDSFVASGLQMTLNNAGAAGAAFLAQDIPNMKAVQPRQWAVAHGTTATDVLALVNAEYYFSLVGPNGFARIFSGNTQASNGLGTKLSAYITYSASANPPTVDVNIANNDASASVDYNVTDAVYGVAGAAGTLAPGASKVLSFDMSSAAIGNWYDWSVSMAPTGLAPLFTRRFMGRMETGKDTISDPAMAKGLPGFALDYARSVGLLHGELTAQHLVSMQHPDLPDRFVSFPRVEGDHKDAMYEFEVTQ
jgi:phospholipase C